MAKTLIILSSLLFESYYHIFDSHHIKVETRSFLIMLGDRVPFAGKIPPRLVWMGPRVVSSALYHSYTKRQRLLTSIKRLR